MERFIQATFDGKLFAVTPQGAVKWTFQAGREIKSSPAIADDGTIYFGRVTESFTPSRRRKTQMDFPVRRMGGFFAGHRRRRNGLFGSWMETSTP